MTPARQSPRRPGPRPERGSSSRRVYAQRNRRWLRPALTFLAVAAAATAGAALYLGFAPGVGVFQSNSAQDSAATDSLAALLASMARPQIDSSDMVDSTARQRAAFGDTVAVMTSDSVAGEVVYRRVGGCLGCHGVNGEGAPSLAPSLLVPSHAHGNGTPAAIGRVVANGLPSSLAYRIAMPAYAEQLSEQEIAQVAAFVYALSHPGRVRPDSAALGTAPAVVAPTMLAPSGHPTVPRP